MLAFAGLTYAMLVGRGGGYVPLTRLKNKVHFLQVVRLKLGTKKKDANQEI